MKNLSAWLFVVSVLALMVVASGCSTVQPLSEWHAEQSARVM